MLSINYIRENPDKVKEGVEKKQVDPDLVDEFLELDQGWKEVVQKMESKRADQNKLSEELASDRNEEKIEKAKRLKKEIKQLEEKERDLKNKRNDVLAKLPNIPFEDVTVGQDESDNKVVKEVGEVPEFDFDVKDHLELGESLGLINVEKASEVSGSRFNYLLGDAVLLEFALIRLCFDVLLDKGFKPIIPPVLARPDVLRRWGKGPFLDDKDAFHIPEDELYLVGSSEHTIGPFHMDETFKKDDLPLRYAGFSSCFRREAGSYGKDTRGILRVHQFDKVEMIAVTDSEQSEKEHKTLLSMQEEIMQKLELPYRVVEICTGDMTWVDAKQFDIETWIPSQGKYRETHSVSNTTDFQSRGINAKYEHKGEKSHVHMLNGTACAIGRTLIAILENYQTEKGTVKVPNILQDYIGKKEISD